MHGGDGMSKGFGGDAGVHYCDCKRSSMRSQGWEVSWSRGKQTITVASSQFALC